ncbi:hypothetical protein, partial [Brucella abortus]|uniref:hypothetical protein n=1 Tax=Brucella abortus TaxID=235 RepID=UPI00283A8EF0
MSLVDNKTVNAHFFERHASIFSAYVEKLLHAFFESVPLLGHLFDASGALSVRFLKRSDRGFQIIDLHADKFGFIDRIDADQPEGGMSHDNRIIVACCHTSEKALAVCGLEVFLRGGKNVRAGIKLDEISRPLLHKMVRYDQHWFFCLAGTAQFHYGRNGLRRSSLRRLCDRPALSEIEGRAKQR